MERRKEKVLVVDDDQAILTTAQLFLEEHFSQVDIESNPAYLPQMLSRRSYDVVLLDMNFRRGQITGAEGMIWLKRIHQQHKQLAVVVMTAYGDVELAVEAMKQGAFDFVVKPWKNARLLAAVIAAANYNREKKSTTATRLKSTVKPQPGVPELLGNSLVMQHIRAMLSKVAATDAPVLIGGESGTGKGMVARQLHQQSSRVHQPFVQVDMGAITNTLIESELFGHKMGAFTDAKKDKPGRMQMANGGTLFLDEIANLSIDKQAILLKALEEGRITPLGAEEATDLDIRLVTASHQPIDQMVAAGTFRQDLYYRINTFVIELPPLRERLEDLPILVPHFWKQLTSQHNKHVHYKELTFIEKLQSHSWPGNIRELYNVLERTFVLANEGQELTTPQLLEYTEISSRPETFNLQENEAFLIKSALAACQGNVSKAARKLGIDRNALYRRMKKYGIQ